MSIFPRTYMMNVCPIFILISLVHLNTSLLIYSTSARGGARKRIRAPRERSPKTGKRYPPKSPTLEAMRLAFWATLETATSAPSTIIFGDSVRAAKAGRATVDSKGENGVSIRVYIDIKDICLFHLGWCLASISSRSQWHVVKKGRHVGILTDMMTSLCSSLCSVNLPAWLAGCTKAEAAAMMRARTKRVRAILKIIKFYLVWRGVRRSGEKGGWRKRNGGFSHALMSFKNLLTHAWRQGKVWYQLLRWILVHFYRRSFSRETSTCHLRVTYEVFQSEPTYFLDGISSDMG